MMDETHEHPVHTIVVKAMRRMKPFTTEHGATVVAQANVEVAGIELKGVRLAQMQDGNWSIFAPRRTMNAPALYKFLDSRLRSEVRDRLVRTYQAILGTPDVAREAARDE